MTLSFPTRRSSDLADDRQCDDQVDRDEHDPADTQRYVESAVDRTPVGRDRRLPPGTEDVEQDRHHNQQDQDDRYRHAAAPNPCVHKKRRMKPPFAIRDGDRASAPRTLPCDVCSISRAVRLGITASPPATGDRWHAATVL